MALFDPSALPGDGPAAPGGPAPGPPDPNQISDTPDVDLSPGPPVLSFADGGGGGSAVLEAGATEWLHALLAGADNATGLPLDVAALILAGDVSLAVTLNADPAAGDWHPAAPLRRPEGVYARLLIGPSGMVTLAPGKWRVYVRLTLGGGAFERRLPGFLGVE